MVESGKSFIKNIRSQGKGGIYDNIEEKEQAVKQQRAQQLADNSTIEGLSDSSVSPVSEDNVNERRGQQLVGLGNAIKEGELKDWFKKQIGSAVNEIGEKIVGSKVGQSLIETANTIGGNPSPETIDKMMQSGIGRTTLGELQRINEKMGEAKQMTEEQNKKREQLITEDMYEDTAKIEKVAGIDEEGNQIVRSSARIDYENFIKAGGTDEQYRQKFPDYWVTEDGQTEYRTNGNYVVDRPVGYTTDLVDTLQDAYNSVTYAYAQNGTVYTPDDLKKAYPEYANVSDGALANFISGCMWDVQNGKRSDIKTVADAMGEMSLAEGYTNRYDSYIDLFSDESFVKYGLGGSMERKSKYADAINAGIQLKDILTAIKGQGAYYEGQSDWQILSNYRYMESEDKDVQELVKEIDEYMTYLEKQEKKGNLQEVVQDMYQQYENNVRGASRALNANGLSFFEDALNFSKIEGEEYLKDLTEVWHEMRDLSEDEGWYPLKNVFEIALMGKFFRDSNGNYYKENILGKDELVYSMQDNGTYLDTEGTEYSQEVIDEATMGGFVGKMARGVAAALTAGVTDVTKAFTELPMLAEATKEGDFSSMHGYVQALARDIYYTYFDMIMAMPKTQVIFSLPIVGDVAGGILDSVMTVSGRTYLGLLETFGVTDGYTTELKKDTEELGKILGLKAIEKAGKRGKGKLEENPKYRALKKAFESFMGKISKAVKIKNVEVIKKMIKEKNRQIEEKKQEKLNKLTENQQKTQTTLDEDVRVQEKMKKKIYEESDREKQKVEVEGEKELEKTTKPYFSVARKDIEQAKDEFFNEFFDFYKEEAGGIENMDPVTLAKRELDSIDDPELKKELIEKYDDIYREQEFKNQADAFMEITKELLDLNKSVQEGLEKAQKKELQTTKQIQERENRKVKLSRKLEKINTKFLGLRDLAKGAFTSNTYRYVLKNILNDIMNPEFRRNIFGKKKVKKWTAKSGNAFSRVKVQERIIEHWKGQVQEIVKKLFEKREELYKIPKEKFGKDKYIDITDFFTDFLRDTKTDNIVSKMFKDGTLEIVMEDGKLKVEYHGDPIKSPQEAEVIDILEYAIETANESLRDGKLLFNERSLYNFRKYFAKEGYNKNGKAKRGERPMSAQDLYELLNDYIDTYKDVTGVGKAIRAYDAEFQKFFEIMEIFEDMFNKDGEIKKESKNRIINIAERFPTMIDQIDKLIPGTKEVLDLVEQGPEIITSIVTFMEKTHYRTWMSDKVFKYGGLAVSLMLAHKLGATGPLGYLIASVFGVPLGETFGGWFQKTFGKQVPYTKEINRVMKQLELTDAEKEKVEKERPAGFEKTLRELDEIFDTELKKLGIDIYERGRNKVKSVYDEYGNEIKIAEDKGGTDNPPSGGNGPTGPKSGGPTETKTHESAKETSEDTATEQKIERETDDALAESFKDELSNVSKQLNKLVVDFVAGAEDKKEAKMRVAAAGFKITNTIVSLLDSPEVRKAKEKAEKLMKKDDGYKELQELISKTTGDERRVYTNALYKLILAQKAPSTLVSIDPSELSYLSDADLGGLAGRDVGKQKKNTKYQQATARISGEDIEKEVENRDTVKNDDSDYDQIVKEGAKKSESKINKNKGDRITEGDVKGVDEQIQKKNSDTAKGVDENDEQYQEDVEKERTSDKYNVSNTERDLKKRLRITAKEGENTINEVGQLSPEKMDSRDNIWFSFDKFGSKKTDKKDRMRYNDKNQRIVNHKGKDYIDGGALYGTAEIDWGGDTKDINGNLIDSPTKVYVNSLEVFDNFPSLEKLPKDTLVLDTSTNKVYTIDEIRRMDVHGETNRKSVEKYYEDLYNSYPKEVQDIFAEEGKTEKSQVQSSSKGKSEAKETQAEQSTTKEEKQTKSEQESEKKSKPKKISPEEEAHLFGEDKKTAEESNADSLVEAIKKYNGVDVAEFISHKWDKKGKTHIHLKDMTASDSRSFQEFVMNHKDLIEIYDDGGMGYVIKFKPGFKDNIKKYLK